MLARRYWWRGRARHGARGGAGGAAGCCCARRCCTWAYRIRSSSCRCLTPACTLPRGWAPVAGRPAAERAAGPAGTAMGVAVLWQRHRRCCARLRAPRTAGGQAVAGVGVGCCLRVCWRCCTSITAALFGSAQLSLDVTRGLQLTGFSAGAGPGRAGCTRGRIWSGFFRLDAAGRRRAAPRVRPVRAAGARGWRPLGCAGRGAVAVQPPRRCCWACWLLFGALVRAVGLRALPRPAATRPGCCWCCCWRSVVGYRGAGPVRRNSSSSCWWTSSAWPAICWSTTTCRESFCWESASATSPPTRLCGRLAGGRFRPARRPCERRVARQYLGDYFDKYESQRDALRRGRPASGAPGRHAQPGSQRWPPAPAATRTDQRGVYLLRSGNSFSSRRYVALAAVGGPGPRRRRPALGTVRVELTLKKLIAVQRAARAAGGPEVLSARPGHPAQLRRLRPRPAGVQRGRFDYANRLPAGSPAPTRASTPTGWSLAASTTWPCAVRSGRTVVMTTATYSLADWLANFSFQFLLAACFWLLAGRAVRCCCAGAPGVRLRLNFSTRIQLLLNVGIVVPLLVVSVATVSQLIASLPARPGPHLRAPRAAGPREPAPPAAPAGRHHRPARRWPPWPATWPPSPKPTSTSTTPAASCWPAASPSSSRPACWGRCSTPQAVVALRERGRARALLTEQAGSLVVQRPVPAGAGQRGRGGRPSAGYLRGGLTGERGPGATILLA
ncbi:MAG: hypothetical protein WKG07_29285 [Hymenobacter sp.]